MKIIAGPCVIEQDGDWLADWGAKLLEIAQDYDFIEEFILKASYDKANRTEIGSFRSLGMAVGLAALERARRMLGIRVLTDFHNPDHAKTVGSVANVLQVPAFLGRQTDMIRAGAYWGPQLALKKPQWEGAEWARHAVEKAGVVPLDRQEANAPWLIHRGDTRGVVDFVEVADMCEVGPTFIDITHSNRQNRRNSRILAVGAALPITGLFMEVHPDPDQAFCDGPNQLSDYNFRQVLDVVGSIRC